ncbi:MAG TPA: hypothetical protein VLF95_05280 [Vicinamibacteria bacterium]|nr:hypothetical protein [Vicinamibacteria bacterium]
MTMRAHGAVAALAVSTALLLAVACGRRDRKTPDQLRAEIQALEEERQSLRERLNALIVKDPRVQGMPDAPVRVGVPTALARDLIQRVVAGFVDQVTLELKNLKVRKRGTVKKVVTLGQYDLRVTIHRVSGRLKTGRPDVKFGGNQVSLALPVRVASGSGNATIHFEWDGKGIADATCGDLEVTQEVSGGVRPDTYQLSGGLVLVPTAEDIVAEPRFPPIKINLKVVPSERSWGAVKETLDEKEGLCGYVVEKIDILGIVQKLVDKGFNVRLPTERIKAMAVPVGIEPTMEVRGQPVALGIKVGQLAITEHVIWLGAQVSVRTGAETVAKKAASPNAPAGPAR